MTWNHRVVRRVYPDASPLENVQHEIHEAYYDEKGECDMITVDAIPPTGGTVEELRECLAMMTRALDHPVLDYETRKEIA
jgi:hypothetical protein